MPQSCGADPGIFGALHTYGRQLNWNCHIHLSWTTGGISEHGVWKKITFHLPSVRKRWMWNVRQLLLSAWDSLRLPPALAHLRDADEWKRFILSQGKNEQGEDYWHVYFAKPTKNARQTAKYLGRYLKKPPVAEVACRTMTAVHASRCASSTTEPGITKTWR